MNEPLHPEVAILNTALELAAPERAAYLDGACAGDAALRLQVEALLKAHEQAEGFLEAHPIEMKGSEGLHIPLTEKPGDRLGRYKLLQQIGEGGCGVVYMAEQEEPVRRRVALKVIKLGMDTKQVIARFEAERQALALMDHANIAKVFDAGATETGRPYFVMELVRGIKITEFCDENKVSTEERLKLFIQVCQAIQHAHQKGIIHRDIKPSNILITVNDGVPVPKVIDFGIAKATQGRLTERTLFTPFEQFIGTPAYMSPEQAVMTSLDVDTRGDIYSLGVLLYELLTGRTPFDQKELLAAGLDEMRRTIREKEPPKPSTRLSTLVAADLTTTARCRQTEPPKLVHSVRGDLDWIVMKALEKDRARRYETANGLAADVQHHLNNEPVNARSPSNLYRLQKLVQRNRLTFAATAAVVVALVLALVVLGISNARITREKSQKERALEAKGTALQAAQASEQRARDGLFTALKNQAQARRYSRQMGQRFDSLSALVEADGIRHDPMLRDDAIAALAMSDVRRGSVLEAGESNTIAMAWTPRFDRCASLDQEGVIRARDVTTRRELRRLQISPTSAIGSRINQLSFSPDGSLLAYFRAETAPQVWRLSDGHALLHDPPQSCSTLDFSPDSRQFILADADWVLSFDSVMGRERRRWQADGKVRMLAFSPDGRHIAASVPNQQAVSVFDASTGEKQTDLPVGPSSGVLCWHPDGNRLAVVGTDADIEMWNVAYGRKVATLRGHIPEVTTLSFHRDGGLLVSGGWDGTVRLWEPASGREVMQIPFVGRLQFSADGRWLGVIQQGRTQLLEVAPTGEYHTLVGSLGTENRGYYDCTVSSTHPLLAVAMEDGVRLWDLNSWAELAFLETGLTLSAVFAPDGCSLFTSGTSGLRRWPIEPAGKNDAELNFGPPRKIALALEPRRIAAGRDGKLLGVLNEAPGRAGAMLVDLERDMLRGQFQSHAGVSYIALSPDTRWLATGGWHSDRVRLWDAQNGKLAQELIMGASTRVAFTPDSRRLVTATGGEFAFRDLESLEPVEQWSREIGLYPGDVAFSPDGKLMAMEMSPAVLHLKEVATGRTVARLEDPFGDRSVELTFSSDGTKLIVLASYAGAIHVWDLRVLRSRLKPMGLDWDWPEFPPLNESEERRAPLKIRVVSDESK